MLTGTERECTTIMIIRFHSGSRRDVVLKGYPPPRIGDGPGSSTHIILVCGFAIPYPGVLNLAGSKSFHLGVDPFTSQWRDISCDSAGPWSQKIVSFTARGDIVDMPVSCTSTALSCNSLYLFVPFKVSVLTSQDLSSMLLISLWAVFRASFNRRKPASTHSASTVNHLTQPRSPDWPASWCSIHGEGSSLATIMRRGTCWMRCLVLLDIHPGVFLELIVKLGQSPEPYHLIH